MMWQDFVFLIGSMTSVLFLYPTLRDTAARVPRATSIPSMIIGGAYSFTFLTLGMTFSAAGAFAACTMWSLIAAFRGPDSLLEDPRIERAVEYLQNYQSALVETAGLPRPLTDGEQENQPLGSVSSIEEFTPQRTEVNESFESEHDAVTNSD